MPGNKQQIQNGRASLCVHLQPKKKNGNHISFPPSTMILKCSEVMYVTYTSKIFPNLHSKKQVFVEQYLGLFLVELGIFLPFCARPSCYHTWFQAPSSHSDRGNWPGDKADKIFGPGENDGEWGGRSIFPPWVAYVLVTWLDTTQIRVHQRSRWIKSEQGVNRLLWIDAPWSKWYWTTYPHPGYPKGMHPKWLVIWWNILVVLFKNKASTQGGGYT